MVRLKIGEILLKQGLLTQNQLVKAIDTQKTRKGRLGEVLLFLQMITEEDLAAALAKQLSINFVSYDSGFLTPHKDMRLDKIIPFDFARKNIVIPLHKSGNVLTCAVFDPLDYVVQDNLKIMASCDIEFVVATRSDILKAINDFYVKGASKEGVQGSTMLDRAVEKTYTNQQGEIATGEDSSDAELSIDTLIAKAEEAPVIKLVDLVIRQAIDERASDIHFEPYDNQLEIRYRTDGVLYKIPSPSAHLTLPIISRVKILAKMDIAEKRLPQDGSITAKLEDRVVDIRVSTVPTIWGEKVVMRLLDKAAVKLDLMNLGYLPQQLELIRKSLKMPYGLFLVTGPTGSGKSTTLYSCLNEIMSPSLNIMSVEDPVEFKIKGINQVAVRADIGLTFASVLRTFLRQDPDIIMVGEVRDLETAQICARAALTGHLVLSTLHTNDAPSAISRLMDIGVAHYLLTPSLIAVVAQRLVRQLCHKCKEPYEAISRQFDDYTIKADVIYKAKGCGECNHIGYKGSTVVSEVMVVSEEIRTLVSKEASYQQIRAAARNNGMLTLFESGMRKVEEGITTIDEVLSISG